MNGADAPQSPDGSDGECVRFYLHLKRLMQKSGSGGFRRSPRSAKPAEEGHMPFGPGRDPQGLGATLDVLSSQLGWDSFLSCARLLSQWDDVVGEETARHSEPVSIARGVLTVRCSSTAWATQLRILRAELVQRIAQAFPGTGIETIRFDGPDVPSWKRGLRAVPGRGPRDTYG